MLARWAERSFASAHCQRRPRPRNAAVDAASPFTTWGEGYIEDEIPADPDGGFVDGWTVRYDKFLVNIQNIVVAEQGGDSASSMTA